VHFYIDLWAWMICSQWRVQYVWHCGILTFKSDLVQLSASAVLLTVPFQFNLGIGLQITTLTNHEILYGRQVSKINSFRLQLFIATKHHRLHESLKFFISSLLGQYFTMS
jgi:hypothetical protein